MDVETAEGSRAGERKGKNGGAVGRERERVMITESKRKMSQEKRVAETKIDIKEENIQKTAK